jgi:hypothetical protein
MREASQSAFAKGPFHSYLLSSGQSACGIEARRLLIAIRLPVTPYRLWLPGYHRHRHLQQLALAEFRSQRQIAAAGSRVTRQSIAKSSWTLPGAVVFDLAPMSGLQAPKGGGRSNRRPARYCRCACGRTRRRTIRYRPGMSHPRVRIWAWPEPMEPEVPTTLGAGATPAVRPHGWPVHASGKARREDPVNPCLERAETPSHPKLSQAWGWR